MAGRFDKFREEEPMTRRSKQQQVQVKSPAPERKRAVAKIADTTTMRVSRWTHEQVTLIKVATGENYQQILEAAVALYAEHVAGTDSKVKGMRTLLADYQETAPNQTSIDDFLQENKNE